MFLPALKCRFQGIGYRIDVARCPTDLGRKGETQVHDSILQGSDIKYLKVTFMPAHAGQRGRRVEKIRNEFIGRSFGGCCEHEKDYACEYLRHSDEGKRWVVGQEGRERMYGNDR